MGSYRGAALQVLCPPADCAHCSASLDTDVVRQSCSGQHRPFLPLPKSHPGLSRLAAALPTDHCAILQPHPSIQPARTPGGFSRWSTVKSRVGKSPKTKKTKQSVSVLSLLEKRCSLAFSEGLFWERCTPRIAVIAPRSRLGWRDLQRR